MKRKPPSPMRRSLSVILLLVLLMAASGFITERQTAGTSIAQTSGSYIVQADQMALASRLVEQAGGTITHRLAIIDSVAAQLDAIAHQRLQNHPDVVIYADQTVAATQDDDDHDDDDRDDDNNDPNDNEYHLHPSVVTQAYKIHDQKVESHISRCTSGGFAQHEQKRERKLRGAGVTVGVIDTGLIPLEGWRWIPLNHDPGTLIASNGDRCIVYHDVVSADTSGALAQNKVNSQDPYGHGTHVVGTIANSRRDELTDDSDYGSLGIAPDANLVVARALGDDGSGSYADVIAAIQWMVDNQETYGIRVLNLSLYAPVIGPYWDDPLAQAVMRAWQAGIVVVSAAGNSGPEAGTVTVPGNVPYVITVGAMTSAAYTSSGLDELASYSSRGPTESAFVKPDVVVPASRTIAPMPINSFLATEAADSRVDMPRSLNFGFISPQSEYALYELSGTSMAAAEVSGVIALMLQVNPNLTNNQIKYRLMTTARLAVDSDTDEPRYTAWEQGAGLIDTEEAIFTDSTEEANAGMDIALDLDPTSGEHYWGNTEWDELTGNFVLRDPAGAVQQVVDSGRRA
ncbi:MAG: S8 family peptidase, partial [Chloroflexaceae bacterium]|nr:S8 family peptidase [Chloroflexaceae bacterium]